MTFTNSSLVSYTKISPNRTQNRSHEIDTITIHRVVGQCSVHTLGDIFAPTSKQASSNYGVGYDGKIGMYVEEKDRSWCSSNSENDNRAVTIEVASDTAEPYAVNDKAYAAMLDLVTDICKRNGIKKLVWSTNKDDRVKHLNGCNMTVHRDFANKSCPGTYLYERHAQIAAEVNRRLAADDGGSQGNTSQSGTSTDSGASSADVPFLVKITATGLNIRTGPGTNYAKTGKFTGAGVFTIVEVKDGPGSVKGWGRLKSGAGWASLDFTTNI